MKDRVPINPGRVLITPENGNAAFYATMTRADNPTQEGDPLNKNTLLKDATAALYGLGADAVPDDVLRALKSILDGHATDIAAGAKIATGSYIGTGTYGASNPCSLTFDFVPQFLWVRQSGDNSLTSEYYAHLIVLNGETTSNVAMGGASLARKITWNGKTVSWYNETYSASYGDAAQLNRKGAYVYMAIG